MPIYPTLTREEIIKADDARINAVTDELRQGFRLIEQHPKSVTFYGSARFPKGSMWYEKARRIAHALSQKGYSIVTGGGPGIMEAAHEGGFEANGKTVGLNIHLPSEQKVNPFAKESVEFKYFFTRRVALSFAAEAYLFFPGGFGTLDEFYELVTLVQTRRIPPVPLICVGSEFWTPFDEIHKNKLLAQYNAISPGDEKVYEILDNEEDIVRIVAAEPVRNGIVFPHA